MIPYSFWILMFAVVCLTALFARRGEIVLPDGYAFKRRIANPVTTTAAILLMAFFAGATIMNDVWQYMMNFIHLSTNLTWDRLLDMGTGANPLFEYIQLLFKRFISKDPADFHLFEGLLVEGCFVLFYRRYSPSLPMSLFMFVASGLFYFSIVSWKQSMAMAIGLAGVPLVQNKKYIKYFVLLGITMLIHPYIIMYGLLPFLVNSKVWEKRNILIVLAMCIAGYMLSDILDSALEVTEVVFGDNHDAQWFTEDYGVSWQRIVFFAITPALSWIYRRRIDEHPYPLMNGFIQMSVISFGFMFMSMFGGANFISRMGTYFEPFTYVALPYILLCIVPKRNRPLIKYTVIVVFLVFFCFLQIKNGSFF